MLLLQLYFRHGLQSYFSWFLTRLLCSCPALLAVTLLAIATRRSTARWHTLLLCFELCCSTDEQPAIM